MAIRTIHHLRHHLIHHLKPYHHSCLLLNSSVTPQTTASVLWRSVSHSSSIPETGVGSNLKDSSSKSLSNSSLNQTEVAKFAAIAETWWDYEGPFKPLHLMNPTRVSFIRSTLCRHFRRDPLCHQPFEGLKFIDVGCGGGILSEPLARMGATMTAIDAVDKNIQIARLHAETDPLTSSIEYSCTTAEQMVEEQQKKFDAVISLEV